MDEVNVKHNNIALSVFRSACGCLSDAPISIVASSRAQVWCVSPMEAVPASLCIFECAGATWFAGWACSADTSSSTVDYSTISTQLEDQTFVVTPTLPPPPSHLEIEETDKISSLITHVPVCWIRSTFYTIPPNSIQQKVNSRVESVIYTVGASRKNAASMVPRIIVLSSVTTNFAECLANIVAEHGGRCGALPDASVFESLPSLRSEVISRSVQMPFFSVSPEAGIDRMTAQLPVLAETLALFEGSLYKPCVVTFHSTAIWTTADQPPTVDSLPTCLETQCVTATQQSIFLLNLPLHLPTSVDEFGGRSQLQSSSATSLQNFCGGARLRLFDLDTISLIDDGRSFLLVSRNGCCCTTTSTAASGATGQQSASPITSSSPSAVLRVLFPTQQARSAFVSSLLRQCEAIKHPVIVCGDPTSSDTSVATCRVPKTILDLNSTLARSFSTHEVLDIGSAVAVADTEYCTSIESSNRPLWPVTFPVFADGFELTEFWKLLSLHTASMLVKFSRVVPNSAHSSLALRITSCVNEIVGERWGRAYLLQRAATVLANCALSPATRRDDSTLSLQLVRFLVADSCVLISQATKRDASRFVSAQETITSTLRDVEAVTSAKPVSTTDRNVPSVTWEKMQEQILLVMVEGSLALGSDSDLVLNIVAPFAEKSFAPGGLPLATRQASQGPLSDLSKMDAFMATALNAFPASLFCATHPLPCLWRLVRPFLLPLLRSFFTRDSFDSMFPRSTTSLDLTTTTSTIRNATAAPGAGVGTTAQHIRVLTENEEVQTVDSPLWKLLREQEHSQLGNSADQSSAMYDEIEAATAGQIYLNRLFGGNSVKKGGNNNNNSNKSTMRPSPPVVEDWLQLASMVAAPPLPPKQQSHQSFGSTGMNQAPPTPTNTSLLHTPKGGGGSGGMFNFTVSAGGQPQQQLQQQQQQFSAATSSQILERRDQRIGVLELREESLQATISALHGELASVRGEVTALLSEKRFYRLAALRERIDHLVDKEVTERRLLMGQEEVDRCGLHNYLIDHAIQESVALLGEAGYRTLMTGGSTTHVSGRGLQQQSLRQHVNLPFHHHHHHHHHQDYYQHSSTSSPVQGNRYQQQQLQLGQFYPDRGHGSNIVGGRW